MNIIYNRNSTISITSDILIGSGAASGHYDTYYNYDRMGNITSLTRIGLIGGAAYGIIDNLDCNYDGNRLTKVEDSAADADQPTYYGAFHFNDGADSDLEYAYDANGNMTRDLNKGITEIKYNLMNLPSKITYSDGKSLSMTYSAEGERLSVTHNMVYTGDFNAYFGPFIYRNGSLQRVLVDGGYTSGSQYHFYLTDHLGNNRVVVGANGTVEQVNHYYPYGGLTGESTGGSVQPYKYNGKELERMNGLDLYDYGARWMDAALGRFTTIDPLCEKHYGISPYAYCAGNPINRIDPDGREWYIYITGNQSYINIAVNLSYSTNINNIESYKDAISNQISQTFSDVSNGTVHAKVSFYDNNVDIQQSLFLGELDANIAGLTTNDNSSVNIIDRNHNLKSAEAVGIDTLHELLHTIGLLHPFENPQTADTQLIHDYGNNYISTPTTDKKIINNAMNYESIYIDGEKCNDLRCITKGQLELVIKEVIERNK